MAGARIILVYNADTGLVAMVSDWLVKHLTPARYACRLCALTYGSFTMRKRWAETLAALPLPWVALHRDEWQAQFPGNGDALPAIFRQEGDAVRVLVSADDFARLDTLGALEALLAERLAAA